MSGTGKSENTDVYPYCLSPLPYPNNFNCVIKIDQFVDFSINGTFVHTSYPSGLKSSKGIMQLRICLCMFVCMI